MAPTVVLVPFPTTHKTMNSTTTVNTSLSYATSCATVSQTTIISSDISIHTLVPDTISTESSRKALISKKIPSRSRLFPILLSSPSENYFFLLSNLQGVGFSNVSSKPLRISDRARRCTDFTHCNFCSIVSVATVDIHAQSLSWSLEFSLWVPQSLRTSTSNSTVDTKTPSPPVLVTTPSNPIENISFKLGNFSDNILSEMVVDQIWTLLIDSCDTLLFSHFHSFFIRPTTLFISP